MRRIWVTLGIAIALAAGCADELAGEGEACGTTSDCKSGLICYADLCVHPGTPVTCMVDAQCPNLYICIEGLCEPKPAPECGVGFPCPAGQECVEGTCIGGTGPDVSSEVDAEETPPPECTSNGDCPSGKCNVTAGTCYDPHCEDESDCDDDNACTTDLCDPAEGCFWENINGDACEDGNACTSGDTCVDGICDGGAGIDCNDNNACTSDFCDPVDGCEYTETVAPCDDGNQCTVGDVCNGGICALGTPIDCGDGNVCTADSCDPGLGCLNMPQSNTPCDDADPCTLNDLCQEGKCQGLDPDQCNDSDVCTDDICDPIAGCLHEFGEAPCSDGDACTVDDHCVEGGCTGGVPADCSAPCEEKCHASPIVQCWCEDGACQATCG